MDDQDRLSKKKGISTFIATLLLIVLVVAAGVLIYAYTMGYLGGLQPQKGNPTLQVQSVAEIGDELHIYAKNIGSGMVTLDPNALYVNDVPTHFTVSSNDIAEGETREIIINEPVDIPDSSINGMTSTIKIIAVGGTFTTVTTKINNAGSSSGGNTAPTAAFTFSATNLVVDFDGSGSSDSDGTIASYSWDWGDGTAAGSGVSPSHTYAAGGTYTVTLTVTDEMGSTDPVSHGVTVSTVNIPPTADFHYSATDLTVTFTDASTDSDGNVVSWDWDFGDGESSTLQNPPPHTYALADTYTVTLTVTDDDSATNDATQDITVTPGNVSPSAAFSFLPAGPLVSENVVFTDASTDSEGSVVTWSWDFGDGGTSILQNPSHAYATTNTYTVRLTIVDNDGATDFVEHSLTVSLANVAPAADFTWNPNPPNKNVDTSFSDASTDSDGNIVSWSWDFGDTGTSTSQNPTHVYAASGDYTVTLVVTDDDGATGSKSHPVHVNIGPFNWYDWSPTTPNTGQEVSFDGSATDSDGTIAISAWDFGDGGTSNIEDPKHTFAASGIYDVLFTVTDNDGATDNTEYSITVTSAPITITLQPNAAGSTTQNEAQGSGSANWDRVDELTIGGDGTTTYVRGDSEDNWQDDSYNIQDQSLTGSISNVKIYIVCNKDNNDLNTLQARTVIRIGSNAIEYGATQELTTSWATYSSTYSTKSGNLGTGSWTPTDINNLQIGVSLKSQNDDSWNGSGWTYAQCTQVWVEITYIPG